MQSQKVQKKDPDTIVSPHQRDVNRRTKRLFGCCLIQGITCCQLRIIQAAP